MRLNEFFQRYNLSSISLIYCVLIFPNTVITSIVKHTSKKFNAINTKNSDSENEEDERAKRQAIKSIIIDQIK